MRAWRFTAGLLLLAVVGLACYRMGLQHGNPHRVARALPAPQPAAAQPAAGSSAQSATRLRPPLVGATYMGGNWPKNFINAFRREDVAADFRRLRADGFDTVLLLVSWGDFQPVFEPCCRYDERAFARLEFLIAQARSANLDIALRVGYGWTFHPDAGEVGARIHRLLNDDAARAAFMDFAARIGAIARRNGNVRLSLLSWEDLILHRIDGDGRRDFRQFVDALPPGDALRTSAAARTELPHRGGERVALFNAYWDWLLMHKIFAPAAALIPHLTFEARIDSEPLPHRDAGGKVTYEWIGHESTYRPPGADVIALYWAPFWGARNEGEALDAPQASHLFGSLLDKVRRESGGLPMFIDQFNVIDNTLGFERNARLADTAIPRFMDDALCVMRAAGVFGYAYWTTRDYAESPLYNPSFAYGLDGWQLQRSDARPASGALQPLPSGDFDLVLVRGDELQQAIPATRGRLTGTEKSLPATVCAMRAPGPASMVQVAVGGRPVQLKFRAGDSDRSCARITTRANADALQLEIRAMQGTTRLRHVALFDHVQQGGLYDRDGKPQMLLADMRKLNEAFRQDDGRVCRRAATH